MGDYISLLDALMITVISMIAVFVILILISSLINGLRMISEDKKKKEDTVVETNLAKDVQELVAEDEKEDNGELIVVIASVVAIHLGLNIPDIKIKSIKRVPQRSNPWSSASRIEEIRGRF